MIEFRVSDDYVDASRLLKPNFSTKAIIFSGVVIGIADGLAAITSAYLSSGVTPDRVFQYIASGAIGKEAFSGGIATVLLGILFHFFIALSFAAFFYALASRRKSLLDKVFITGVVYGTFIWLVMNVVVIPFSKIPASKFNSSQIFIGLLIHIFVIGIPMVWLTKQHLKRS
jgi:asparagine N-glycosylation enzyme membrane subunit Stt3